MDCNICGAKMIWFEGTTEMLCTSWWYMNGGCPTTKESQDIWGDWTWTDAT